jgi:CRP-like cAMP-binding protein
VERARWVTHLLRDSNTRSARGRVVDRLAWLRERFGADMEDAQWRRLPFIVTQADLGAFAGVTREFVNRTLADLEDAGMICQDAGRLVIHKDLRTAEDI